MLIMDELYIYTHTFIYIMFECIKQHVDMINVDMIITLLYIYFLIKLL